MSSSPKYLIDSDVLITAKNRYYSFQICPGFWDSVLHSHSCSHLHSIDQVKQELLSGSKDDDLVQWVGQCVPASFFLTSDGSEVVAAYSKVISWVSQHMQYHGEAKTKFASGADGWLVAHGIVTGQTIVTNEQPRPDSRRAIKLPNAYHQFNVKFEDTFPMLHRLGVQYHYSC